MLAYLNVIAAGILACSNICKQNLYTLGPNVFFGIPIWAVSFFPGALLLLAAFCWLLVNPCWLLGASCWTSPKSNKKPKVQHNGQWDFLLGQLEFLLVMGGNENPAKV